MPVARRPKVLPKTSEEETPSGQHKGSPPSCSGVYLGDRSRGHLFLSSKFRAGPGGRVVWKLNSETKDWPNSCSRRFPTG